MATTPREASARHARAKAFGYPLHRLTDESRRTNPHGVAMTDLTAACGHRETQMGGFPATKDFRSARTGELCEAGCWS